MGAGVRFQSDGDTGLHRFPDAPLKGRTITLWKKKLSARDSTWFGQGRALKWAAGNTLSPAPSKASLYMGGLWLGVSVFCDVACLLLTKTEIKEYEECKAKLKRKKVVVVFSCIKLLKTTWILQQLDHSTSYTLEKGGSKLRSVWGRRWVLFGLDFQNVLIPFKDHRKWNIKSISKLTKLSDMSDLMTCRSMVVYVQGYGWLYSHRCTICLFCLSIKKKEHEAQQQRMHAF